MAYPSQGPGGAAARPWAGRVVWLAGAKVAAHSMESRWAWWGQGGGVGPPPPLFSQKWLDGVRSQPCSATPHMLNCVWLQGREATIEIVGERGGGVSFLGPFRTGKGAPPPHRMPLQGRPRWAKPSPHPSRPIPHPGEGHNVARPGGEAAPSWGDHRVVGNK